MQDTPGRVWFHRGLAPLSGGQAKRVHYFGHVRRMVQGVIRYSPVVVIEKFPPSGDVRGLLSADES